MSELDDIETIVDDLCAHSDASYKQRENCKKILARTWKQPKWKLQLRAHKANITKASHA